MHSKEDIWDIAAFRERNLCTWSIVQSPGRQTDKVPFGSFKASQEWPSYIEDFAQHFEPWNCWAQWHLLKKPEKQMRTLHYYFESQ